MPVVLLRHSHAHKIDDLEEEDDILNRIFKKLVQLNLNTKISTVPYSDPKLNESRH
jgi:hypothetical protein